MRVKATPSTRWAVCRLRLARLPWRFGPVDVGPVLVDVGDPHALSDPDRGSVGGLVTGDHLEQGGLANPVGADNADDSVAGQTEGQVGEQLAITERLAQVFC